MYNVQILSFIINFSKLKSFYVCIMEISQFVDKHGY